MAAGSTPGAQNGQGSLPLDKGKRHRLGEAGGEKYPPEAAIRRDPVVGRRLRRREHGERGRQTVESVMPPDFFDEVDLARHIDAEARNAHAPGAAVEIRRLHIEAERRQDPHDVILRHVHAEHAADPRRPQRDAGVRAGRRIPIDEAADCLAGADLPEEGSRAADASRRCGDVASPLEADRCFSLQSQPLARPSNGGRVEARTLERDSRRSRTNFGAATAHDAADRRGPRRVGDDQHFRIERTVHSVQRRQALARPRAANHERLAVEPIEIERVHRLADLQHHVVRDVDDVADRSNARRFEALGEPARRRTDRHLEHLGAVARAERFVFEADLEQGGRWPGRGSRDDERFRLLERMRPDRRGLARDAEMVQAIRAVGRDLEVDRGQAAGFDRRHLEAAQRDLARDFLGVRGDAHHLRQPRQDDLHSGNCSRKRRSFS